MFCRFSENPHKIEKSSSDRFCLGINLYMDSRFIRTILIGNAMLQNYMKRLSDILTMVYL